MQRELLKVAVYVQSEHQESRTLGLWVSVQAGRDTTSEVIYPSVQKEVIYTCSPQEAVADAVGQYLGKPGSDHLTSTVA